MELIKLSKFKLQLQTLITEVRELREKERDSSDQLHNYLQKQKQRDEEFCRKIMELEAELASSNELCQKLDRKVHFLENENYLLESKHKELKETINSILQSKEGFVNAYQESICEMKRSIESRDRKIVMLSEKINAHILSFDTIQKEASFVKQVVDNAHSVVNEKEEHILSLLIPLIILSGSIKDGNGEKKINDLKTKLESNEIELKRKDRVIAELQIQLETTKITDQCQSKIEELQETVLMKEGIIQTLVSENKALRSELGTMEVTVKMIQDTMARMDEEDGVGFSIILANQEKDATEKDKEDDRINHDIKDWEANSHHEACRATVAEIIASPSSYKEYASMASPLRENNNVNSCVSESAFPPPSSAHYGSQPAANAPNVCGAEEKDNCSNFMQQLDSECSTTQAGTS